MARIIHASSPEHLTAFRDLCHEYALSLPQIGLSLEVQGFEREMATLPGCYAPPCGTIVLTLDDAGRAVGCAALRPLDEPGVGELKRMYVRPDARGRGLGHALAGEIVNAARLRGYRLLRLDTDTTMHAAIRVYSALGFRPRERYNNDPCPCTLWFELDLTSSAHP